MSTPYPRSGPLGVVHPVVLERRLYWLLLLALSALVPLALALGIAVAVPHPNLLLALALFAGVVGVLWLLLNDHLEVSLVLLAVYLGMLDGPIKLGTGGHEAASVVRDVLIFSVAIGAFLRLVVKRERLRLPPLSGWVIVYVALVLAEAFNPNTHGFVKALGGFRQQLEWVPFFFFGYAVMRSKERLRKFFLILGVIALANAVVATVQTRMSPQQVASWGPGYHQRIYPEVSANGHQGGGRVYIAEGEGKVRPMALGSDSGFGGGVGLLALPCTIALLAMGTRRRWLVALLCLGSLVAVATSLGRLQVVGAAITVVAFAGLAALAGRRVSRPLAAIIAIIVLAVPLGILFVSAEGGGTFNRYQSIGSPSKAASTSTGYKEQAWKKIPHVVEAAPFGVGLGTVGAAGGFGGHYTDEAVEGHGVTAETQYNFLVDELGAPGLILWVALVVSVVVLAARRLRTIPDGEMRIGLAAVFSAVIAMLLMGFSGPLTTSAALGPFLWFATGVASYWFLGPGSRRVSASGAHT
jgi:hypothetical protein